MTTTGSEVIMHFTSGVKSEKYFEKTCSFDGFISNF